ncbi:hypothetical protein QBC39DRAFT_404230 [Podospora conica]|nr:hypothetical protein QBC39DRAFT_404230 [Schizothecium conicum]
MSAYRGVNVSQYLRNLNVQEPVEDETIITDDDLALFTNTQFFDFETGQNTDYQAAPVKPDAATLTVTTDDAVPADPLLANDFSASLDYGNFSYEEFSSYTSPTIPSFSDPHLAGLQPIQPNPQSAYPHPSPVTAHPQPGYVPSVVGPVTGEKRKAESDSAGRMLSYEDANRLAAEEDKRKRNTAASARFRIKKKQREQALEKSAKEMTDKVTALENRIATLETENKWLKSLVTEKHGDKGDIVNKLLKEFVAKAGSDGGSDESSRDSISVSGSSTGTDESPEAKKARR